jgi:hypothetical protein
MLNDDILNHPILDHEFETSEEFDNIEKILIEAGITMPEKFTWEPIKETATIHYDSLEGKFYSDEIGEYHEDITYVYDAIRQLGKETLFDESVFEAEGLKRGVLGGVDFRVRGGWRMMFQHNPSRSLEYSNYLSFLKNAKYWLANQEDWVAAYQFIEHHPAFWNLRRPDKYPYEWDTEGGHRTLWVFATKNDKGEPVVMIEGGSSVAPNHDHHYHDYRMDVWGKNFEDAYIQFAQNLHKYFSVDGIDRGLGFDD